MSTNVIQTSLAGGELSPTLDARVDLAKYHSGMALMENFFVDYRGGASNRPGTRFISEAGDSTHLVRLIPFQFSVVQNYMLEFGEYYMRVILPTGPVVEAPVVITAITQNIHAQVTAPAHGFANGQSIYLVTGGGGMVELNQRIVVISGVTANTFLLNTPQGLPIDSRTFAPFASGTAARVLTVASPFAAADLQLLKLVQSADVITFTHPNYPTYDLIRSSSLVWNFVAVVIGTSIAAPAGLAAVPTPATPGTAAYAYVVTAVAANGDESVASNIADVTLAIDISATAGSILLTWGAVAGAVSYNVYKANPSANSAGALPIGIQYGFAGIATSTAWIDTNIIPDFIYTPPIHTNPFTPPNYPGTVTYFQQRKTYAASNSLPETFWMSQVGSFKNFDVSNPVISSDAITGTLVSRQLNNIKYMIAMPGGLVALTGGGAWQISGGGPSTPVTPTAVVATPQAYSGCADVEPLTILEDILYVQSKGAIVRDLSYNFYTNIYTGKDLTVLSNHLFTGYSIKTWAYAESPYKIVWTVRSDGKLLSLTWLKEQEIGGWAQHNTQGTFESCAVIPEGNEDAVYFVVARRVGNFTVRMIERMASRLMTNGVVDAWFVDAGLQYNGPPVMTVTGLSHLEGRIVAILGDGNTFPNQVVSNGSITISQPCSKILVGLPYEANLQTLRLDVGDPTIQGKRKKINALTVRLDQTRGLKAGPTFGTMKEFKERTNIPMGSAIPLKTGDERLTMFPWYTEEGQICIRQSYPLPATVLGIIPEITVGDKP